MLHDASARSIVEAEDRIDRMERDGVISPQQAGQLRASIRRSPGNGAGPRRARRTWTYLVAAIALIILAATLVLPGGEVTPVQDVSRTLNDAGAHGAMNKSVLNIIAAALFLALPVVLLAIVYNGLVNREEAVFKGWAQVESQLQRRADLVPRLVEIVSGYARHERETLGEVTAERSRALTESLDELVQSQAESTRLLNEEGVLSDQARMDELARVQQQVGKQMSGFLAIAEDYPDLRASDQFLELQAQLEGPENRINVARLQFNESVADFNASIRRLPGTLVAGLGSFQRKAYFQAEASAAQAPDIEFN